MSIVCRSAPTCRARSRFRNFLARLNGVDLREVGVDAVGAGNLNKQVGLIWGAAAVLDGIEGLAPSGWLSAPI